MSSCIAGWRLTRPLSLFFRNSTDVADAFKAPAVDSSSSYSEHFSFCASSATPHHPLYIAAESVPIGTCSRYTTTIP
eukprot:1767564-Pleurochrysis_carterae.AAC.1